MRFENPQTGSIAVVSPLTPLWVLLFGFFYFAAKGVWPHVLGGILFAIVTFGLSWLFYPFFAIDIMRDHYRKRGWVELDPSDEQAPSR